MSALERLTLELYGVVMRLLCPWVKRRLARRAVRQPLLALQVQERFGHYDKRFSDDGGQAFRIWVHAVSLGETRAAGLLMRALRTTHPEVRFLLTHSSATGRAEGEGLLGPGDLQVWQPWDAPAGVQRFLDHFEPQLALMMETEVWPNWVQGCRARGIPLCLVNARLSEKSARSAQRLAWLAKPAYSGLTAVWAQTSADAQRLQSLGAPVVGVLGNLKFDAQPHAEQARLGRDARGARPAQDGAVITLASSREGEEVLLLEALLARAQEIGQRATYLVVPRHPERFDGVARIMEDLGFEVVRRSSLHSLSEFAAKIHQACVLDQAAHEGPARQRPRVFLGDSMGEMNFYYALTNVALMGATFKPLGGQNLIEALANGCPVVLGPHTFNFQDTSTLALKAGVARSSSSMQEGLQTALNWVKAREEWLKASECCVDFIQAHQGASESLVDALAVYLPPSSA